MLVLLVLGAGAAYAYVNNQFYVGVDGEQVAIFRGVTGEVAGVSLSSIAERTDLDTGRVDALASAQLEKGIVARDRADAEQIVSRLEQSFPVGCTRIDEPDPSPSSLLPPSLSVPISPTALPSSAPDGTAPSGQAPTAQPVTSPPVDPGLGPTTPAPSPTPAPGDTPSRCPAGTS